MARLLLFDANTDKMSEKFKVVECNELDDFYKYLECRCFDIAHRKIGNHRYDIFVDDEGLFADDPVVSAIDTDGRPMLVGNLIFANHDSAGETTSLSDDDIKNIQMHTVLCDYKEKATFMVMCEY